MGTSTDAHCEACGYDTFLILGGGMADFGNRASWPVSCARCSEITTANFAKSPLACDRCRSKRVTPMSDERMWQGDGHVIEDWNDLALTSGHYRCPKCGTFELRFGANANGHPTLMWD